MARPLRIEYPGAFYHVTSRGNERNTIFVDDGDRRALLSYFTSSWERYGAVIHAYCLMTNHYHLLVETPQGNLSQIMRHINGAYTNFYNARHARAGHLFQGRYRAILVEKDAYAAELSRYIHLNPVRAGIIPEGADYPWSSCRVYAGKEKKPEWLETQFVLGYFGKNQKGTEKTYKKFLKEGTDEKIPDPLTKVIASTLLGGSEFIEAITTKYLKEKQITRDIPALKSLTRKPIEEIARQVERILHDPQVRKKATIYVAHRYSGMKLKEIGAHFGLRESGVSQAGRRFASELKNDRRLRDNLDTILLRLQLQKV